MALIRRSSSPHSKAARPPRGARLLLRLLIRDPDHEFLAGDLEELFHQIARDEGIGPARRWFRRQALRCVSPWMRFRFQRPHRRKGKEKGSSMLDNLRKDLLFAVRLALKRPTFSLVVILTLGLGIGANTAVYSLIDAFVFRGLPVPESDRIVSIFNQNPDGVYQSNVSYAQILDIGEQAQSLSGTLGFSLVRASLNHDGLTEILFGEAVTANYFDVLKVTPELGRAFVPEEGGRFLGEPVVVVSHGLWQRRFGSDPGVVGTPIQLNGVSYTVVGVAPPEFVGSKFALSMSFWVPVQTIPLLQGWKEWDNRQSSWLNMFGRLAEGATLEQLQTELDVISRRLQQDYPAEQRQHMARAQWARGVFTELDPSINGAAAVASGLATAVALLILLIACANVANLVLARTSSRASEIGLRLAIGASRPQILRQLSWESLVLALVGGALGVVLAFIGTANLPRLFPEIPYEIHFPTHPSPTVLLVTLLVTTATGMFFGLVPMFALRKDSGLNLQANQTSSRSVQGGWRTRRGLVVLQIAASLLLLMICGLFVRSLSSARQINPGFSNSNLLMAMLDLGVAAYTRETGSAALPELESRLSAIGGVEEAGLTTNLPLDDSSDSSLVWARGIQIGEGDGIDAQFIRASPDLFPAFGIRLLEGRLFDDRDRPDSTDVALVSKTLAEHLWRGESPLGRMISLSGPEGPFLEVVGMVDDVRYESLSSRDLSAVYLNLHQHYSPVLSLVLKTSLPPASLAQGLREVVRDLNPNIPVFRLMSFEDQISNQLWPSRMGAVLASIFGVVSLLLASVGLYGLMSFAVSRRIRELGIRTALGANRRDLLWLVLFSGSRMVLGGLGGGLVLFLLASRPISSLFYGGGGFDLATFGVVAVTLGLVALLACYLPARRAARVDPMEALRYQ